MDNKIFKRIVAAAAGVTMLGTCAFATGLTTASYSDGTLSFDYTVADGATKVTYLAYAATVAGEGDETFTTVDGTNYVLGNIVAVNQLDEIPETKSEAVAISADLLGEATNIVLMSGDDLGSDVAYAAVATAPAAPAVTVTFVNGETSTTLAVDKLSELAKPANIKLSDLTLTEDEKAMTFALSELSFLGWTTNNTDSFVTTNETVYLHSEADKPAYEAEGKNPSGVTYKTLASLADVTESITLYAKYDTNYAGGDVNGDGMIAILDVSGTKGYYTSGGNTVVQKTGKPLFPLVKNGTKYIAAGDVNIDGSVAILDVSGTKGYYTSGGNTVVQKTGKHIYYVNK